MSVPRRNNPFATLPGVMQQQNTANPWSQAMMNQWETAKQNPGTGYLFSQMGQPTAPSGGMTPPQSSTGYAPFSGALPAVAAVNPFANNNHTFYDNQGDMDARMALGGMYANPAPGARSPYEQRPPVSSSPYFPTPQSPVQAQPFPQPTIPQVPAPSNGYYPRPVPAGQGVSNWINPRMPTSASMYPTQGYGTMFPQPYQGPRQTRWGW